MRISTTLNTLNPIESKGGYPAEKIIGMLHDAGFRALDICAFRYAAYDLPYGDNPYFSDRWQDWAEKLRCIADEKGIVFNQSHNSTFNFFVDDEKTALLNRMVDRCIDLCAMLGIPNTVLHPIAPPGAEENIPLCLEKNKAYFSEKAEYAAKKGVNLCLENMLSNFKFDGSVYWRYCTNPEELLQLVEAIGMPNVGICYDVGHAHYMRGHAADELRMVKPYLWALHIHDNDRWNDEHLCPYQGTIQWEEVCRALAEIGYSGDFTLEIAYAVSRMPEGVQPLALRSAYQIAEYLVSRIEHYSK